MNLTKKLAVALPLVVFLAFAQSQGQRSEKERKRQSTESQSQTQAQPRSERERSTTSAQSSSSMGQTYKGYLVDANCSELSAAGQSQSSYSSKSETTTTSSEKREHSEAQTEEHKPSTTTSSSSTYGESRSTVHHGKVNELSKNCAPIGSTTSFALLTSEGQVYKLDSPGNSKAMQELGFGSSTTTAPSSADRSRKGKRTHVIVTGTLQGDTLQVESIRK